MIEDRNQKSLFDTQQDILDEMREEENSTCTYQVWIQYSNKSSKVKTFTGKWKHDREFMQFFKEEYNGLTILDYKKM